MSYKAVNNLKNHFEIEFLKSCSYENINEMMNKLNDKIKKLEAENKDLRASAHNSDYAKCLACAEDITTDYDININPELIAKTIGRHFA